MYIANTFNKQEFLFFFFIAKKRTLRIIQIKIKVKAVVDIATINSHNINNILY